jgi:hypothetical protein
MLFYLYKGIQTKARMSSAASDHLLQIKSHELSERFWLDETHVTVTGDPSRDSTRCDYQGRPYPYLTLAYSSCKVDYLTYVTATVA